MRRRNPYVEDYYVQREMRGAKKAKRGRSKARRALRGGAGKRAISAVLGCMNPGRKGSKVDRVYRHFRKHGTAGMSKRQLRALSREMDIGVNPRSRYYKGRKSTRKAWNPVLMNPRGHRGHKRKNRRHYGIFETTSAHGGKFRSRRGRHEVPRASHKRGYIHGRRNPVLMNPKRDGSMTKGESRLQKHAEWLRLIADRGRKATAMLKSMHTVPVASHAAIHEHAEDKVSATVIAKAMDGVPAAVEKVADVVEHAEAKFLRQQIADLTMLINSTKDEATSLGEQDESLAEELMEQVAKMSKQRKTLQDKAAGLGIRTNPRRRSVLVGTRAYARALAELRAAIHRRPR